MGGTNEEDYAMKPSDLIAEGAQPEESKWPHPVSSLADPPVTLAEALAVDLGRDTTICRWHRGQLTHLNVEGKVYFCATGRMYFRHTKLPSEFLRPLQYRP
jgi:hypothetical protein